MSTATFIGTDTGTGGLWIGTYGGLGYSKLMPGSSEESLPPGVSSINFNGASTFGINANSGNNRDLQRASSPTTFDDAVWFDGALVKITVTVSDGATRALAVYMRDSSASRTEGITIKTAGGSPTLDSQRAVSGLTNGVYYRYEFSGSIDIEIANLGGPNCVVQGVFFDTPGGGGGGGGGGGVAQWYYPRLLGGIGGPF